MMAKYLFMTNLKRSHGLCVRHESYVLTLWKIAMNFSSPMSPKPHSTSSKSLWSVPIKYPALTWSLHCTYDVNSLGQLCNEASISIPIPTIHPTKIDPCRSHDYVPTYYCTLDNFSDTNPLCANVCAVSFSHF